MFLTNSSYDSYMIPYFAPLADIRFLLTRLIGLEKLNTLPTYETITDDLVEAVLSEAAKIASEQFAPLNHIGDKIGAQFDGINITMPTGYKEAYQAFVDGGWNGLPVDSNLGGQGLPWLLAMPVQEMLQSANLSLALATLLNQGAIDLLAEHGNSTLKATYLPKMVSGEWSGTMNLTEPQAGSDVGAVRCRATPENDHYLITGQKIFISYGDHDLTKNIIHLVLARLPDAPEGTKGLSLFLVPKILVNADGSLGHKNDVRVISIEHKLGQHASPTCVMAYGDNGGATGYLVGSENSGIAAMFTMMNNARIGVGVQGLGLMERAYQQARDYAKIRVQSRDILKPRSPSVTIINHPDIKRMLLSMKAHIEAARALAYSCAYAVDVSKNSTNDDDKKAALIKVDILTPVIKSWLTDLSNEITSTAVQVCGGMGYIEETGIAQHMRDARVLAIYEGTNGIQANDLVFRKIARDDGIAFQLIISEIATFLSELSNEPGDDCEAMHSHLSVALSALKESSEWIAKQVKSNALAAAASAVPFLRLTGNILGGYYLIRSAVLAQRDLGNRIGDPAFLNAKIITARFYASHVLPLCKGLSVTVIKGSVSTLSLSEGDL